MHTTSKSKPCTEMPFNLATYYYMCREARSVVATASPKHDSRQNASRHI